MNNRSTRVVAGLILAAGALMMVHGLLSAQPGSSTAPTNARDADRDMIVKAAQGFAEAFNKRDAKAIAAHWTDNGECREADGETFRSKEAIEKAYAEFFKANPAAKIDVMVKSVRFPAKDLAVEEGLVRQSTGPKSLPRSTSYVAIHIRESGQWKIALSGEGNVGQDRIEDLEWLLGTWVGKTKDNELRLNFAKDAKRAAFIATVTKAEAGKESVGHTVHIASDPETGRIRSWCFEANGAHSQSLWRHDGKAWLLETRGVLADGTPTTETIVIQRINPTTITWRSIDRVVGDQPLPDTKPMPLNLTK